MNKTKSKLLVFFAAMLMFFAVLGILSACGGKTYTVTFMVQNEETGEWEQYGNAVTVGDDGSVTIPEAPSKDYYTFSNWYTNSEFSGEPFSGLDITGDLKVYARYNADQIQVYIDGESQGTYDLVKVINGYTPDRENLVFDGWYTDANYAVEYTASKDAEAIYGRYLAQITFDNGYEEVYTTLVSPGTTLKDPATDTVTVNNEESTVEKEYIWQWYMDIDNIYYYDQKGEEIDFSTAVFNENTTIKVLWMTPMDKYFYNERTDSYCGYSINQSKLDYYSFRNVPAISYLSKVRYDVDGDGNLDTIKVESIASTIAFSQFSSVEKIIINEGIKSIYGSFSGNGVVKEIELPSSLRIIGNSFNGTMELEDLVLPEGLEVIINSFHGASKFTPNDFTIEVPSTVVSISMAPSNFSFTNNSKFVNENGVIYKVDDSRGKILVSANSLATDGMLIVPDGVVGIQVGAFSGLSLKTLILPASWTFVNYNPSQDGYPEYYTSYNKNNTATNNALYSEDTMYVPYGKSILNNIADCTVYVRLAEMPSDESLTEYVLTQGTKSYTVSYGDKVLYIGEVAAGEVVTVNVELYNWMTGKSDVAESFEFTSGAVLTRDNVIANVSALSEAGDALDVRSITQFNSDYDFTGMVSSNIYLSVTYGYNVTGFTYTVNEADGTAIVTGFDRNTAYRFSQDANDYLVYIRDTVVANGKTYAVTAIADNAFNVDEAAVNGNYDNVTHVVVSSSVKSIGEYAFYNTQNMERVYIIPGGLETIETYAFGSCGITDIALPLTNLTYVAPYAFKTDTLETFSKAEGEESRAMYSAPSGRISVPYEGLEEGMYFLLGNHLIQYVSTSVQTQPAGYTSYDTETKTYTYSTEMVDVNVYDVRLIATCGNESGTSSSGSSGYKQLGIGYSTRRSSLNGATDAIVRYEVMEGSVYYMTNHEGFMFVAISKIHKNAFTDIAESVFVSNSIYLYRGLSSTVVDSWLTEAQITAISSADYDFDAADAIFEDGWLEGWLTTDGDYEEKMAFLSTIKIYTSIWGF